MEAKEVIQDLREQLTSVKKNGKDSVSIDALEDYLTEIEKISTETLESRQLHYQGQLAHYDAQVKSNLELFKATIEASREALNSVILINGGAAVAMLSFLGSVAIKSTESKLAVWLTLPLLQFGLGVFLGSTSFAFRYFSQSSFAIPNKRWGDIFRYCAIASAVSAFVLFCFGVVNAYHAFLWRFLP